MRLDVLRLKAELLCWGIRPGPLLEKAYRLQNPQADKRTGNAGLQIHLANDDTLVNVPVLNEYNRHSPYELKEGTLGFYLEKDQVSRFECDLIPSPQWYALKTGADIPLSKILVQEGRRTLITAVYNGCDYRGEQRCRYCAIRAYEGIKWKDCTQIRDATIAALSENPAYHLHLTGGNVLPASKSMSTLGEWGMSQYHDTVRAIRAISEVPISIEASPPACDEHMNMLVEAGVNSFCINLEIWDEKLRKMFCPGKSIITRHRYFEVYDHAISLLGKNMVASVLIGGLESKESTVQGAEEMARVGVIPTVMPLRRNDGSWLQHFISPSPDDIVWISRKVGELLYKYDLKPWEQPGCTSCGACSLEQDYQKRLP